MLVLGEAVELDWVLVVKAAVPEAVPVAPEVPVVSASPVSSEPEAAEVVVASPEAVVVLLLPAPVVELVANRESLPRT